MKVKTIKKVIEQKIDDWLESIEDAEVRSLAANGTIVTGGCIASMLLKEKVNDYDLYFRNKHTAVAVAKYYVERFQSGIVAGRVGNNALETTVEDWHEDRVKVTIKSSGVATDAKVDKPYEYFESRAAGEAAEFVGEVMDDPGRIEETYEETEGKALDVPNEEGKPKYRPVFLSTNAITLSGKIQLVLRFFGNPDEIHENYDYVHCTNYWASWEGNVVLRPDALKALLERELYYVGSKYPVCSVFRLRKFIQRGWKINAGQILKMLLQVSALDLTQVDVLQDQLTGVDCAYFMEVLRLVKEKYPERVNAAYLVEIVDRMF